MPSVDPVVQKIRNANLPPFVMETTLPREGWQTLRDIISGKKYKNEDGDFINYAIMPPPKTETPGVKPVRAAALMAKELLLTGVPVLWMGLAGLLREVRLYSPDVADPLLPVWDHLGRGYLVIGDFDNTLTHPSPAIWTEGLEIMMTHHHRGGGLIIVCDLPMDIERAEYTRTFAATGVLFTRIPVV